MVTLLLDLELHRITFGVEIINKSHCGECLAGKVRVTSFTFPPTMCKEWDLFVRSLSLPASALIPGEEWSESESFMESSLESVRNCGVQ